MPSNPSKDYYKILDIHPKASFSEIKKAYHHLMRENHPDKVQDANQQGATEKTQELVEAYTVLSDESKRRAYDLTLENPVSQEAVAPSFFYNNDGQENYIARELHRSIILAEFKKNLAKLCKDFPASNQIQNPIIKEFIDKNLDSLNQVILGAYGLFDCFTPETLGMILLFDSNWLKSKIQVGNDFTFIGKFVRRLSSEYRTLFLDHILGKNKTLETYGRSICGEDLRELMKSVIEPEPSLDTLIGSSDQSGQELHELLSFFGIDYLRRMFERPYQLSWFLFKNNHSILKNRQNDELIQALTVFLNGNDEWLTKTLSKGEYFAELLHGGTREALVNFEYSLNQINPHWKNALVNTPGQMKHLFKRDSAESYLLLLLGAELAAASKLSTIYRDKHLENLKIIENLCDKPLSQYSKMTTAQEEKKSERLSSALQMNIELVSALSEKQIHKILVNPQKGINDAFANMHSLKDKPYFSVYLLALTKAYAYEERQASSNFMGPQMFNWHVTNIQMAALLGQTIENGEELDLSKISQKLLQKIGQSYREHRVLFQSTEPFYRSGAFSSHAMSLG